MRRITDWFRRRESRTLTLPARGRAIVVSDLHGNLGDWQAFLARSEAIERIAAGEDLYLILTGDVPDVARHRTVDRSVPPDGDVQVLDALIEARARLGANGRRIVYVEGNHDYHVARIALEIARFDALRRGAREPGPDELPSVDPEAYALYCANYRETYGEAIFQNNVAPYDMVPRAKSEHLRFVKSGPVLVLCEGAGVVVAHAGPPRMEGRDPRALRKEIDGASAADLDEARPEQYFASAYHQLLNNRFRHGDYDDDDLRRFLAIYDAELMISGHTPHPYLLDFEARSALAGCAFHDGVGRIGQRQIVLCTSFGSFTPAHKRYLEFDLSEPVISAERLLARGDVARRLYDEEEAAALGVTPLPGAEILAEIGAQP